MTTALLIGDGASLDQWREYVIFNNFDYTIGTYCHLDEPDIDFDYYAIEKLDHCYFVNSLAPEQAQFCYTTGLNSQKTGISNDCNGRIYHDTLYTLQMRIALNLGATHIVTVAWDWMNLSAGVYESALYRTWKPVQQYRVDRSTWIERRKKLRANFGPVYKRFESIEHKGLRHHEVFGEHENMVLR